MSAPAVAVQPECSDPKCDGVPEIITKSQPDKHFINGGNPIVHHVIFCPSCLKITGPNRSVKAAWDEFNNSLETAEMVIR